MEENLLSENEELRRRLIEAEETLLAIRNGEVDALVVKGMDGQEQVYTLKGANQPYRILIETMNEGALTLSVNGTIVYCNSRFSEMLNLEIEWIMGRSIFEFVPEARKDMFQDLLAQSTNGRAKGEAPLKSPDGRLLPALFSLRSLTFEGRQLVCMVVTDLSDQKRAEERLRDYAGILEKKNKELQNFAFVASHDLQEPLRKIKSFGDLLAVACDESLGDRGRDYLHRMEKSIQRMQSLIQGLLAFSRLTSRAKPFVPVDLREKAEEAISNLEVLIAEKRAQVEIGSLPVIDAEPHQILQLFQNLIGNALKFSKDEESPVVRVSSEVIEPSATGQTSLPEEGEVCRIMVEDNGIGFDEKYLDRIFVPFQRLHGRGRYGGTGIGLAVCRRIVEHHGGEITAKSVPGEGSTFIVTLPVTQKREDDD